MMYFNGSISIVLLHFLLDLPLISQELPPEETVAPVTLERTEIRTLHSDISGDDYELWISFPSSSVQKIGPPESP